MADSDEPLMFEDCKCRVLPGVVFSVANIDGKLVFKVSIDTEERILLEWKTQGAVKNVISEFCEEYLKILFEIDSSWLFKLGSCRTCVEGVFDFDLNLIRAETRVLA